MLLLLEVTETSCVIPLASLICANVASESKIADAFNVTFALSTFGIPLLQFAAFDHKLSPPALVKLD